MEVDERNGESESSATPRAEFIEGILKKNHKRDDSLDSSSLSSDIFPSNKRQKLIN